MQNGILFAILLISLSGTASWYSGILLIKASDHCKKLKYEEIAECLYGKKFRIVTTVFIILALLASNISYIVYVIPVKCFLILVLAFYQHAKYPSIVP